MHALFMRKFVSHFIIMKKAIFAAAASLLILSACSSKQKSESSLPADFKTMGDQRRVQYMMQHVAPDSLARFIIYGALGRNPEMPIDTLGIATNYAYEHLSAEEMDAFAVEYDAVVESLPLDDKMRVYKLGGQEDPQRLGYKLGLEYMQSIRSGGKSVADVEKEIASFKKACASDTATYRRFVVGFRTVLQEDQGKDMSRDIYNRFINLE